MALQTTVYEFSQGRACLFAIVHIAATDFSRHNVVEFGVRWRINKYIVEHLRFNQDHKRRGVW